MEVFWKNNTLISGLNPSELNLLKEKLRKEEFKSGDTIIKEGDIGDKFYFIEDGLVRIIKNDLILSEKGSGEHFGFMSLVDDSVRSANVVADTDIITYSLTKEDIEEFKSNNIYINLLKNHIKTNQSTVRNMNDSAVEQMKEKLRQAENSLFASRFFVIIIFFLVFYQFLLGVFIEFSSLSGNKELMDVLNPSLMIIMAIAAFIKAKTSKYPLSVFGLNTKNWKKNIIEALLWTLAFIMLTIITKWFAIKYSSVFEGQSLFDLGEFNRLGSIKKTLILYGSYAILAPVQEFIARGVIQGSLYQVIGSKHRVASSIILSNLMFSAVHIHFSMHFAILTLIPGIMWGILYHRQKSLVGVSISHIIIGIFVLVFMGFV